MEQLSEIEVLVGEAETRVERLRSLYDQYFMGIERIEPQTARKDVERRIQILRRTQIRNTALRFRFQNVLLRYNTFAAHWMRICRQIEDGTYKHHLRKAKERFDTPGAKRRGADHDVHDTEPPPPGSMSYVIDEDLDVDVDFDEGLAAPEVRAAPVPVPAAAAGKSSPPVPRAPPPVPGRAAPPPIPSRPVAGGAPFAPQAPPAATAPRPGAPAPAASPAASPAARPPAAAARPAPAPAAVRPADASSVSDERVRQIYSKYVETRRSLGESAGTITMDSMAKSLRDSSEKLRQKHAGKNVDFEVQVKDGKTILKPIVR